MAILKKRIGYVQPMRALDRVCLWIAYRLPSDIIYWAIVRAHSLAMVKHSTSTPTEIDIYKILDTARNIGKGTP